MTDRGRHSHPRVATQQLIAGQAGLMAVTETHSDSTSTSTSVSPITSGSRCTSLGQALGVLGSLQALLRGLNMAECESEDLVALTRRARDGQRAIDSLLIRIGVTADQRAAEAGGPGDAHSVLLGDGQQVRGVTARREAARAQTATEMNQVGDAVTDGRIGSAQVDAITQATKDLTPEQRDLLNTAELIDAAASTPVDVFARQVRREAERIRGDHGLADTKAKQAASSWKHWFDERTGMGNIRAEFDPERYESITSVVEQHLTRLANEGGVAKNSNLAATAAFELLIGKAERSSGIPNINVIVDWETFARGGHDESIRETADGHSLPLESIARLACRATIQRIVLDKRGVPVDVGRKQRTATNGQWQAMRAMYRTCAWVSCDRPVSWCQLHHVHEWEDGGVTDLCNLVPLCTRHHHAVHEGGWAVRLHGDRRLDICRPDGRHHATTRPDRTPEREGRRPRQRTTDGDEQPGAP